MRGYGKRSSSVILLLTNNEDRSDVEFSDSSDNDETRRLEMNGSKTRLVDGSVDINEFSSNAIASSPLKDKRGSSESIRGPDSSNPTGSNKTRKQDSSIATRELDIFDFLETKTTHKKRRTNYRKSTTIDDTDDSVVNFTSDLSYSVDNSEINETIEGLDSFLMSLQKVKKDEVLDQLNIMTKEDECAFNELTSTTNSSKKLYDRRRTLLKKQKSDTDSELDEEEDDNEKEKNERQLSNSLDRKDKKSKETSKILSSEFNSQEADLSSTQHFLELKHIGGTLRFEDDLEFLTSGSPEKLTKDKFISKLLNFSLAIQTDKDLISYINKHCKNEVYEWCFTKATVRDPIIILLLGVICHEIEIPINEHNIDSHLTMLSELSKQHDIPEDTTLTQKLVKLNYKDFVNIICPNTGVTYTIKLLEKNTSVLMNQSSCQKITCTLLKNYNELQTQDQDLLMKHLQDILSNYKFELNFLQNVVNSLESIFMSANGNTEVLKSLILITNDQEMVKHIKYQTKQNMYNTCSTHIVNHFFSRKGSIIELLLLYNGLLLNIISQTNNDLQLSRETLDNFTKIYNKLNDETPNESNQFLHDMIYLNFAYLLRQFQDSNLINDTTTSELHSKLKQFNLSVKEYNINLSRKIEQILNI
ncbi:hypothetical protein TPHA_0M00820 [Tetrapisispora phaffii CBS 4417]|uniref:Rad61 Wapl domain-containing protein n=1 Tax=Tetrapisispora phaffii (strain ATCC 24235 / CBS 4417 / NBRC 1672 / NRRL Y-8282 / UCD 70-5) TaxID=1071381 RepID=G8C0E2_TETPH|nr:hypothetical protein TPHA_0M00820 [Tetrapisispora phaffii CBS 4417]CCE65657.1 hypothetical protein TPHA_0M00820 [Tetrapisispora phaffii CBS 4417]